MRSHPFRFGTAVALGTCESLCSEHHNRCRNHYTGASPLWALQFSRPLCYGWKRCCPANRIGSIAGRNLTKSKDDKNYRVSLLPPDAHYAVQCVKSAAHNSFPNQLFESLTAAQEEACLRAARSFSAEAGAFFCREGDPSDYVYLLVSGEVRIYQVSSGGIQAFLGFAYPGQVVGVGTLLRSSRYAASAQATERTRAWRWERRIFLRLMEGNPKLTFNILRIVGQYLDELRERYVDLATQPVEKRVAWALLKLDERQQRSPGKKKYPSAKGIPQKEIADMASTTIYSVSRVLAKWRRSGFVTRISGRYVVRDEDRAHLAKIINER